MSQCAAILEVLGDGEWHSVADIHRRAGYSRLNSRVSELRDRGHMIEHEVGPGCSNVERHRYRLVRTLDETQASSPRGADGGLRLVERPSPPPPGGALTEASASFSPGPTLQLDLFGTAA